LIHQQACAALRTTTELGEMCQILGGFRANLIGCGFSVEGAEMIARELFISVSDAAAGIDLSEDE
jgi:hypothetical protein